MRQLITTILLIITVQGFSQSSVETILTGNVVNESGKSVEAATVTLSSLNDSTKRYTAKTLSDGSFVIEQIVWDYYRLKITYVSMAPLVIDSIWFRKDRPDFHMNDLTIKPAGSNNLNEVIIYSEKPLIQSADGNITFNAGESALSAGSNAGELLTQVPLVARDGDGKITVRGKEPRILIDDKPVELNMQQLQDLLESLPGSSIEKIEVMTNPPPQYANEQGGVINITTRKGKVGRTGRVSLSVGTRQEMNLNANFSYRKNGLAITVNAGAGYNKLTGEGSSNRVNYYSDSTNRLTTSNNYVNKSARPNFRFNLDYDISKRQSFNVMLQLNANDYDNDNLTTYTNLNRFEEIYRMSARNIHSTGNNYNGAMNASYLLKTKRIGESLRVMVSANLTSSANDRLFTEQFYDNDLHPVGADSVQQQTTSNNNSGYSTRINYDRSLSLKTSLSAGGYITRNSSKVDVDASYQRKPDGIFVPLDLLSNRFNFHQTIQNYRVSLKHRLGKSFSATGGLSIEYTNIWFELIRDQRDAKNSYLTWLPFANLNKKWSQDVTSTFSYRRSIRRPGINELNPTIDFSDRYNIRFGNENLEASTSDNFDLVFGKTRQLYYLNLGVGYNDVKDIFSRVRTLLEDGRTQITWQNISGRKEYEISGWGGASINRKLRVNMSASYTFNQYSEFDRSVNKLRNGGSFTSTVTSTYTATDRFNITGSFNFNRFATPQGYGRWNWSMNVGIQQKFIQKRLIVTVNIIDPFVQQRNTNFVYGTNFQSQSFNRTNTRNIRMTAGYNLTRPQSKPRLKSLPTG